MPSAKTKYEKAYSRDFTLAQVEMWSWGESHGPKQWTLARMPFEPVLVFESEPELTHCYYHPKEGEWMQHQLAIEMARRRTFAADIVRGYIDRASWIKPVWDGEIALTHNELVQFLTESHECWAWHAALTAMCELPQDKLKGQTVDWAYQIREMDRGGAGTEAVIRKSLTKLYPELAKYVTVLSTDEIINKKFPSNEELDKRLAGFWYVNGQMFVGATRQEIEEKFQIDLLEEHEVVPVTELRGRTAHEGVVRGKVRRVMNRAQIGNMQEGEIIVSAMTTPDFMPAIQKSIAIVTDEGGVTCHAAIIARELDKPCLIGTKKATKIFKDGDEIEVDATNGMVRKI